MMHSIRTSIWVHDSGSFKSFLEFHGLTTVNVGTYDERVNTFQVNAMVCYMYSDTDVEAIATMTYLTLKYGSVEQAYNVARKYQ